MHTANADICMQKIGGVATRRIKCCWPGFAQYLFAGSCWQLFMALSNSEDKQAKILPHLFGFWAQCGTANHAINCECSGRTGQNHSIDHTLVHQWHICQWECKHYSTFEGTSSAIWTDK